MANYSDLDMDLKTLETPSGDAPESRIANAEQVRGIVNKSLLYDAQARDPKRALLKGLVDGNAPYNRQKMIQSGRAEDCNVNWRIADYFLKMGQQMLYDIFSESEYYSTVLLDRYELASVAEGKGVPDGYRPDASNGQAEDWGRTITEEFQWLQEQDPNFDYCMQQSQGQSVFYGCGPLHFEDELDWRAISHESKDLVVQQIAKSNTNWWEWAALVREMAPDQLYGRIANPEAARMRGWDVPATRTAIMNAHPLTRKGIAYQSWSWHQANLKSGGMFYADQSKRVRLVRFYFREFPNEEDEDGRITDCLIELDSGAKDGGGAKFLYWKPKAYANWNEVVHPMYWKHDLNGFHYSVNGMGLDMYSAFEYLNRLLCRNADDAMSPKMFFRPTTASSRDVAGITQMGRWAILPSSFEAVQSQLQPFLQDGIAMSREIQGLVASNLSQYRSQAMSKQQGNPVTARQIDYEASEQARMGKTQLSRIFEQYDWYYAEKYRRATNPNLSRSVRGGKLALEFWKRCERRGVPKWALNRTSSVKATRVVGQGSQFMRQQSLEFLMGMVSMLPENGRFNLLRDVVASRAGQSKVDVYAPRAPQASRDESAQVAEATLQVSAMKTGIAPVIVPTQNAAIFAAVFLQAGEGAVQSLQQGSDPHEVFSFLNLDIPAIEQHLQRMSSDPTRKNLLKQMAERLKPLQHVMASLQTALERQATEEQQAQQQAAQMQAGTDPETQVGLAKVASGERVKMAKQQSDFMLKGRKQQIDTALKSQKQQADIALDAHRLGADIQLDHIQTAVDVHLSQKKAAAEMERKKNGSSGSD